jgi:hypothetical protein
MNGRPRFAAVLAGFVAVILTGCTKSAAPADHAGHDHSAHAHDERETPARFKAGSGLQLSPETTTALGLKTAEVEERAVRHSYELTASVFDAGPPARASALVPVAIADEVEKNPPVNARLLAVHRHLVAAVAQAELIFALPDSPAVGSTLSLSLQGPPTTSPAVPRSALLRTATGTFVYVVNGTMLLRTPVKTGATDGEFFEILDGLYAGDVVATAGVEQLWLTELRLTKGGGHSH